MEESLDELAAGLSWAVLAAVADVRAGGGEPRLGWASRFDVAS